MKKGEPVPSGDRTTHPKAGRITHERGIGLLVAILVMFLVSTVGTALVLGGLTDLMVSESYRAGTTALHAADYGLEQTRADLLLDSAGLDPMIDASTGLMRLADPFPDYLLIGGHGIQVEVDRYGQVVPGWYAMGGASGTGQGYYQRQLRFPPQLQLRFQGGLIGDLVFDVRSTGTFGQAEPATQVLRSEVVVTIRPVSEVWDHAIFAGAGIMGAGEVMSGNAQIRGSLYLNGDPLSPTRIRWTGDAAIWNHYLQAEDNQNFDIYAWKLPPVPTTVFNGETIDSLSSVIRMRGADIELMGSTEWGEPDSGGNAVKETLDGFFLDGSIRNPDQVYADERGPQEDEIDFPSLFDPFEDPETGWVYPTYAQYLEDHSLLIPEAHIGDLTDSFSYGEPGDNYISWDRETGELVIEGIVRVEGDLELGYRDTGALNPQDDLIQYSGTGTIYATGDLTIIGDLMPTGHYLLDTDADGNLVSSDNNLGLISAQDIDVPREWTTPDGDIITLAHLKVMAAMFAENAIGLQKQDRFAGAFVSKYVDLGQQVPRVFQVPWLSGMLPPGLPGSGDVMLQHESVTLRGWYQVR